MRRIRFSTWCKKDVNDTRKINYNFLTHEKEVEKFTSDDFVPVSMLMRLNRAWVEDICLIGNEWDVHLYED